jgi:hypothetical protein
MKEYDYSHPGALAVGIRLDQGDSSWRAVDVATGNVLVEIKKERGNEWMSDEAVIQWNTNVRKLVEAREASPAPAPTQVIEPTTLEVD